MLEQQQGNIPQVINTIYSLKSRIDALALDWNTYNKNQDYLNDILNAAASLAQVTASVSNSGNYSIVQAINSELAKYNIPQVHALNEEANKIISTVNASSAQCAPVYNYRSPTAQQPQYTQQSASSNYGIAQGLQGTKHPAFAQPQVCPPQAANKYAAYSGPALENTLPSIAIQKVPELKVVSYPITSGATEVVLGEIIFKGVVMDKLSLKTLEPVTIKLDSIIQTVLPMAQMLTDDNSVTPDDIVVLECTYEFNSTLTRLLAESKDIASLLSKMDTALFNNSSISKKDKAIIDDMLTSLFNAAAGTWSVSSDKSISIPSIISGYEELSNMENLDKIKNGPDNIKNYLLGLRDRGLEKVNRFIKSFSILPLSDDDDKTDALKLRPASHTLLGILINNEDFYYQIETAKTDAAKYGVKYISIVQEAYPSLYYQLDTIYEEMSAFKNTGYVILIVLTKDMAMHTYKLHRAKETYFVI